MNEFANNENNLIESHNSNEYRLPVAEMYPELTREQQAEAEYFLLRYFEVMNRIFEEKYDLTNPDLNVTVHLRE